MKNDKRLIFVGGSPRSGTTLVQDIFDSHPDIAGGPEFDRTSDIVELRNKLYDSISKGRIDIYCSKKKVDNEIKNILLNLLLPFAEKQNCEMLSEKTPSNILVFNDLIEIFPESYFIFVVRDPRAIVSSMLDVGKRAKKKGVSAPRYTKNLFLAVRETYDYIRKGLNIYRNNNKKILLVKYEDILTNPIKETKKITEYLNLSWSEDMLYPGEKNHIKAKKGVKGWRTELSGGNIDKKGLNKWRKKLSGFERTYISNYFRGGSGLKSLGYDLSDIGDYSYYKSIFLLRSILYDYYNYSSKNLKKIISKIINNISNGRGNNG